MWGSAWARIVGGNAGGSSPRRRSGPDPQVEVPRPLRSGLRTRAETGALTRSPRRSSSMIAPEERCPRGTLCKAAGQRLRSAGSLSRPGTGRRRCVKQKSSRQAEPNPRGKEISFNSNLSRRILQAPRRDPAQGRLESLGAIFYRALRDGDTSKISAGCRLRPSRPRCRRCLSRFRSPCRLRA